MRPVLTLPATQNQPAFPCCPLCKAPTLNASWRFAAELEHDCNCRYYNETVYLQTMTALWREWHEQLRAGLLLEQLPQGYRSCTFDNYRVDAANRLAWEAGQRLEQGQFLYLWGSTRLGKTHLAVATLKRLAQRGRSVKFWGEVELLRQFYMAFQHNQHPPDPTNYDVLVLDDIGKIKPSDYAYAQLYALIEHFHAHQKTLILTSNYDPLTAATRLARGDADAAGPIASRLGNGIVVNMGVRTSKKTSP
jgi:DNA replication protein DnaC